MLLLHFLMPQTFLKSWWATTTIFEGSNFYTCKGYMHLSSCENLLLQRLVLCHWPCVQFPSWYFVVKKMLFTMVKKTMDQYVFVEFCIYNNNVY
jgi:hypothetical protein